MCNTKISKFLVFGLVFLFAVKILPKASAKFSNNAPSESIFELFKLLHSENITSTTIVQQLNTDIKKTLANSRDSFKTDSLRKCLGSVIEFITGIADGDMWAFSMWDAGSKIPSGLLAGNLVDMGSYDECLDVSVKDNTIQFVGQHCMIHLRATFDKSPFSGMYQATLGNGITYTFSLCIPSSCTSEMLSDSMNTLVEQLNRHLHNSSMQLAAEVAGCHSNDSKPVWTTAEILGACVTILCILPAVLCTILDLLFCRRKRSKLSEPVRKYVIAVSMAKNLKKLLDTRQADNAIQVLHMLKFLAIAWVVLGHRFKLSAAAPLVNFLKILDYLKEVNTMLILSAPLAVDIFFVISGILNVYTFLNTARRSNPSVRGHIVGYIHRYIRLTPAYALMILVTSTWLYQLGDGPLWDQVVGGARDDCTNYWWTDLLYINNYYNPVNNCMLQSWYLAADMQMFLLSPVVLCILWRWPKLGVTTLVLLGFLSILSPFLVAYYYQIRTAIPITLDLNRQNLELTVLYMPTHTKTISYVMGMLGGYVLYLVKTDQFPKKLNVIVNIAIWIVADVLMTLALYAGYYTYQLDTAYNIWESCFYIALYRFFWSISIVWVIVACTTGNAGIIPKVFCYKAWVPLGRLTYCIYLTHAAVILYSIGSLREPQYFSYYTMILKFGGEFIISIALALVLTLTIEAPILGLEKVLGIRSGADEKLSTAETPKTAQDRPNGDQLSTINLPNVLNHSQETT